MIEIDVDDCPVKIFCDGSVRIEAKKNYICIDPKELDYLVQKSQSFNKNCFENCNLLTQM